MDLTDSVFAQLTGILDDIRQEIEALQTVSPIIAEKIFD